MSEFVDHVMELLESLGRARARRMFGGHGIFRDGMMFALVAGDALYLKADEETAADFDALGLPAFTYESRGRRVTMSYRLAPEEALEDSDVLLAWSRRALGAARRAEVRRRTRGR